MNEFAQFLLSHPLLIGMICTLMIMSILTIKIFYPTLHHNLHSNSDEIEIILIRGIPGSGKTTIAKRKYPNHVLCEADQYFYADGEYVYKHKRIKEAHEWCKHKTMLALQHGNSVVVANTFIKLWELQAYFKMGYPVKVIVADGEYNNVHGVPPHVIKRMRESFEPYVDAAANVPNPAASKSIRLKTLR